ncbi:tRNA (N(6)-L-threonylcarbamoyladenosine(37)-C(2))-methylthiotransferase MtaB [Crocinitomix algicola]|uniref:tRNA (N(6)-L-threonylcarbamoyladenosine(37)-C(2))- methylthiotransferase MtaB n=1 Tax=Crocinitomix algicola TaxID=1740263 RepID=UPI0008726567|nr:tRNA (N(6)-L-threonylcarbamoyladenosine(37)-C(2))-methylthiotransferase MtaB [Crocinitomix algicola]
MNQYKKVAFYTLGCKLNFSESSTISRNFEEEGYAKVDFNDTPDIFVINTCSVTENADKKCRSVVRRALKINPNAFITMIGCYAQLKPTEISEIPGVDLVLGANEKFNILNHIDELEKKETPIVSATKIKETKDFVPSFSMGDRTRSFLKVQDGCDYFCTFCTIPLARGKSRNASISETIEEAKEIANSNFKEVVLTGVNIGDFGQGSDENFLELIRALDNIEGIERFRISSIEPNLLSNEIIEFVAKSNRFVPHFHIPLQSGSNTLLKAMRRKYLRELYQERVKKIKSLMPHACIGVDVIVGFPGETEEEFLKTVNFIKELEVSYLHVFTYSERANTTAKKMEGIVPVSVRRERSKKLQILSEKMKRKFYEEQLGTKSTVLFEADQQNGFMHGFSENYLKVKVPFNPTLINQTVAVEFIDINMDTTVNVNLLENIVVV